MAASSFVGAVAVASVDVSIVAAAAVFSDILFRYRKLEIVIKIIIYLTTGETVSTVILWINI